MYALTSDQKRVSHVLVQDLLLLVAAELLGKRDPHKVNGPYRQDEDDGNERRDQDVYQVGWHLDVQTAEAGRQGGGGSESTPA